jgi:poly-gamma-glutamate synthesis protein (capsule biosynthesis protein)
MDYGERGLEDTIGFLKQRGIVTVGAGLSEAEAYRHALIQVGDVRVAILAAAEREFGASSGGRAGAAWIGHERFWQSLRAAREEGDVLVVSAHGGVELLPVPPPHWRMFLKGVVEAGADVVVGHHPHVVQGWELIGTVPVSYSLGDLSFAVPNGRRSQWRQISAISEFSFYGNSLADFKVLPIWLNSCGAVEFFNAIQRQEFDTYIARLSEILSDDDGYRELWNAASRDFYIDRYQPRFFGSSGFSHIKERVRHLLAILLMTLGMRRHPLVSQHQLFLLNLFRNESHSAVARDGLQFRIENDDLGYANGRSRLALIEAQYRRLIRELARS